MPNAHPGYTWNGDTDPIVGYDPQLGIYVTRSGRTVTAHEYALAVRDHPSWKYVPGKASSGGGSGGSTTAKLPDQSQAFRAWDRLMLAIGHDGPRNLNRATFYRARLDDVVR